MNRSVALCLDEQSCRTPALVGLDGEALETQPWLAVYNSATQARRNIKQQPAIEHVWVVSSDDIDPINLAATLKSDRPELHVSLVATDRCGSLCSRAHAARLDEVLERSSFVRRYGEMKQRAANMAIVDQEGEESMPFRLGLHGRMEEGAVGNQARTGNPIPPTHGSGAHSHGALSPAPSPSNLERTPHHGRVDASAEDADGVRAAFGSNDRGSFDGAHSAAPGAGAALPAPSAAQARKGFLMTVVSGSGGAGKSSVAVIAAMNASRRGFRTLLLDYDLQFGDMAVMAAVENALDVDEALAHPEMLQRLLGHKSPVSVLACPGRLEAAETVVQGLPRLLESVTPHFDVIVANTGAAWAEQHAALLERSSVALFLVDQRSSSLRACRHALELCARCGIASVPFRFALNRCAKGAPFSAVDVSGILQGAPVFELREGGPEVEECLAGGAIEELLACGNEFVKSIEFMMDALLPQSDVAFEVRDEPKESSRRFFRRGRHSGRRKGR